MSFLVREPTKVLRRLLLTSKARCGKNGADLHIPVMVDEIVSCLRPQEGQTIVDFTFGAGGHSRALLRRCPLTVVAGDRDEAAHRRALALADEVASPSRLLPLLARFSDLVPELDARFGVGAGAVDGALFDLGFSSAQMDSPARGFALSSHGPLDMRMDPPQVNPMTAADVVNSLSAKDLARVFKVYGEERNSRRVANAIVERRFALGPMRTTSELAATVEAALGQEYRTDALGRVAHVATRVFQALRIFVNNELNELQSGLAAAHHLLRPGGVCAVLSFHSLEDRLVKQEFQGDFGRAWEPGWQGVHLPSEVEIQQNPRSRSAKLRMARKVE